MARINIDEFLSKIEKGKFNVSKRSTKQFNLKPSEVKAINKRRRKMAMDAIMEYKETR
tara:strand:- start:16 stop:189 length:174 start_codon:yes stop_codon:yes gene_type:complete